MRNEMQRLQMVLYQRNNVRFIYALMEIAKCLDSLQDLCVRMNARMVKQKMRMPKPEPYKEAVSK